MSGRSEGRDRVRILALLPRGESLRNFVYTGILDRVAERADLRVAAVELGNDLDGLLRERYGPGNVLPLGMPRDPYPARALREGLDVAHGRRLWSAAARERWRRRDLEATTAVAKLKRLGKKALCAPMATTAGVELLASLEGAVSPRVGEARRWRGILEDWRPDLVFNTSHVHCPPAVPVAHAARGLGIRTAAFLFSWDNLTSQGRIIPAYDHYLVWNEAIREQLLSIYPRVRREQTIVTGTPQFDAHFEESNIRSAGEFRRRIGADPDERRPLVMYSTGMANHMPDEPEIARRVADLAAGIEVPGRGRAQTMVRVYGKDRTGRFEPLKRERPDILFPEVAWEPKWLTPRPEDGPMWSSMLAHCDVGVNVASTVTLELCMFDKPAVNVGFNPPDVPESVLSYARYYEFDHYKPVAESGAVEVARSEGELEGALRRALSNPGERREARRRLVEGMFGDWLGGRSSREFPNTLLELAERGPSGRGRGRGR